MPPKGGTQNDYKVEVSMRKKIRPLFSMSVLVMIMGTIFLAGNPQPSSAQNAPFKSYQLIVYCDNPEVASATFWHDVEETSMGLKSICAGKCEGRMVPLEDALAGLPAEASAALKAMVEKKHEENVAAGRRASLACLRKCVPDPYPEYLRKRQISLELFKHASDLRLSATKLVGEQLEAEFGNLRWEAELDLAGEKGWDDFGRHVMRGMRTSRGALNDTWVRRQANRVASFGPKALTAIGWVALLVETTYRGKVTAGNWSDYQKEAQDATKKAEEMWRQALADLEASLKQAPDCLEASRAAAEDEKRVDRAKAAIEKWDNNQNLYWDPIRNEAVTFEAAVKRADGYLKSGKISQIFHRAAFRPLIFLADDPPSQRSLAAAIRELDKAMLSLSRLNGSISKYLSAQRSIERELEAAFGVKATTQPEPAIPKGKSLQKKAG